MTHSYTSNMATYCFQIASGVGSFAKLQRLYLGWPQPTATKPKPANTVDLTVVDGDSEIVSCSVNRRHMSNLNGFRIINFPGTHDAIILQDTIDIAFTDSSNNTYVPAVSNSTVKWAFFMESLRCHRLSLVPCYIVSLNGTRSSAFRRLQWRKQTHRKSNLRYSRTEEFSFSYIASFIFSRVETISKTPTSS